MGAAVHSHRQTRAIVNRLSRIEGHVHSIKAMVEEGRDCSDVLVQLAAVRAAVNQVGRIVLEDHLESCLLDTEAGNASETWADLKKALDVYF